MTEGWHYLATNLDGGGGETIVATDLPLQGVKVTTAMSGPGGLSATVPVEVARLGGSEFTLFVPWQTCIYAELGGVIRGGGIVTDVDVDEATVSLTCQGFTSFAGGMPYAGEINYVQADPFTIAREFWSDLQTRSRCNLGLQVACSPSSTPVRLGLMPVEKWPQIHEGYPGSALLPVGTSFVVWWTENGKRKERYGVATRTYGKPSADGNVYYLLRDRATGTVTTDDTGDGLPSGTDVLGVVDARTKKPTVDANGEELQPWKLNYFDTLDMGARWDDLAKDGGFDYYEDHAWSGDTIVHTLHLGYPTIGRDLRSSPQHRFEVGVNVQVVPTVSVDGADYCDMVLVIGAGDGRKAARGAAAVPNRGRLHRYRVVQDPMLKTNAQCERRAAQLASSYAGDQNVSTLVVANHPNAPLGSYQVGDTIQLLGSGQGWSGDLDLSLRITAIEVNPDDGDMATLSVARPDKVDDSA